MNCEFLIGVVHNHETVVCYVYEGRSHTSDAFLPYFLQQMFWSSQLGLPSGLSERTRRPNWLDYGNRKVKDAFDHNTGPLDVRRVSHQSADVTGKIAAAMVKRLELYLQTVKVTRKAQFEVSD